MKTFREKVRARWPHYDDRRGVFLPGATPDEMRRVACETQLDCKLTCRSHLHAYREYLPKLYSRATSPIAISMRCRRAT